MSSITQIGRDCVGCGACAARCPSRCIRMTRDREGFSVPAVDAAACADCGLCLRVCPQAEQAAGNEPRAVYAARSRDDAELARSSSGGLFSVAAKRIIADGGAVYGAALDESDWTVRFRRAGEQREIAMLCGSKYAQALPIDQFGAIRAELQAGSPVLFSGCPCQVAALKRFLGGAPEGLTTVEIICHGVPSPALLGKYIADCSAREGAPVRDFRFRTKEKGWSMTVGYTAGERRVYRLSLFDRYGNAFQGRRNYRECCYGCHYAQKARQGDWTIGDYWGVLSEHPEFYSEKGVSMLLVNTERGERLLARVAEDMFMTPSTFEQAARHNENLLRPSARPASRDGFYEGFDAPDFVKTRMKPEIAPKDALKALIPWRLKRLLGRAARGKI